MGLDMYLYKDTYIGIAEYREFRDWSKGVKIRIEVPGVDPDKVETVREQVAYWRKVNCVHQWFVDNVQGGVDECQLSHVTQKQIQELYDLVCKVLKQKGKKSAALINLPTQSGFFFGSTDYDEYYWNDLENTKTQLKDVLDNWSKTADYYYQSSW